jgi:hypothetical protein
VPVILLCITKLSIRIPNAERVRNSERVNFPRVYSNAFEPRLDLNTDSVFFLTISAQFSLLGCPSRLLSF